MLQAKAWPIIYALLLSVVCAMTLGSINAATADRIELNRINERRLIVLSLFGVELEDRSPEGIERAYNEMIVKESLPREDGDSVEYFTFSQDGELDAIAFTVDGIGLWGYIHGYVALEASDFVTIRNVNFDEQVETPGLGAEIVAAWFLDQFVGKSILQDGEPIAKMVAKPGQAAAHQVDGISGATITSDAVSVMMATGFANAVQIAESIQ